MAAAIQPKTIRFNASLCKAGSEMLQAILAQHPKVYATATSPVIDYIKMMRMARAQSQAAGAQFPGQREAAFNSACWGAMQGFYASLTTQEVVVDKSREWIGHCGWLEKILGDRHGVRVVMLVRDLRDVVASFERTYRAHGDIPFGEQMQGKDAKEDPSLLPLSFQERVQKWMTVTPPLGPTLKLIKEAERRDWIKLVTPEHLKEAGDLKPILAIRYEDFCRDPKWAMEFIDDHLRIPKHTYDFTNLWRHDDLEIPGGFGPFGDHRVKGPVNPPQEDGFKDVLREEDEMWIAHNAQWYFELFKYI